MKVAQGRVVKDYKIGLASRAMQISSQITEPDHGVLLDDMFFRAGSDIPVSRFILPRVEMELAFILKASLRGPDVTLFDVPNAVDYVVPALEIIDARIEQLDHLSEAPRKVFDTIADNAANAANAGIVIGKRPVKVDSIDPRWVERAHSQGKYRWRRFDIAPSRFDAVRSVSGAEGRGCRL